MFSNNNFDTDSINFIARFFKYKIQFKIICFILFIFIIFSFAINLDSEKSNQENYNTIIDNSSANSYIYTYNNIVIIKPITNTSNITTNTYKEDEYNSINNIDEDSIKNFFKDLFK